MISYLCLPTQGAKIWLHADACVGGTYLLNEELSKQYVSGSELTDSLCWNPHKLLGAPLQATLLVYRYPSLTIWAEWKPGQVTNSILFCWLFKKQGSVEKSAFSTYAQSRFASVVFDGVLRHPFLNGTPATCKCPCWSDTCSRFLKRVAVTSSECMIFKTHSFRFLDCSESHY